MATRDGGRRHPSAPLSGVRALEHSLFLVNFQHLFGRDFIIGNKFYDQPTAQQKRRSDKIAIMENSSFVYL